MNINLKQEKNKADLRSQIDKLEKDNRVLQNVIHELIMNPKSDRSKGIIARVKQFEESKNIKK